MIEKLTIRETIARTFTLDARGRRLVRYAMKRGGIRHAIALLRTPYSMG